MSKHSDHSVGMVTPDQLRAMFGEHAERTPEQQQHDRRLEHRVDEFTVHFTPGPMGYPIDDPSTHPDPNGFSLVLIQHPNKPSILTAEEYGLSVRHYGDRVEGLTEHDWEETGHATTYPWHRVAYMEHRWWVDEDAFKKAEAERTPEDRPGQYL